jgi:hypothetical protein
MTYKLIQASIGNEIGYKIASALLIQKGEVPIDTIKAIPFFTGPTYSEAAIEKILDEYEAERCLRQVPSSHTVDLEEIIRMK